MKRVPPFQELLSLAASGRLVPVVPETPAMLADGPLEMPEPTIYSGGMVSTPTGPAMNPRASAVLDKLRRRRLEGATLRDIAADTPFLNELEALATSEPSPPAPPAPQSPAQRRIHRSWARPERDRSAALVTPERPTAPRLGDLAEYDQDTRGLERSTLTALALGSLLGGLPGGLAAASGAAKGHLAGRADAFKRDSERVKAGNKNKLDLFKEQNNAFEDLAKLDNTLALEELREGGREKTRLQREAEALRRAEDKDADRAAREARDRAALAERVRQFDEKTYNDTVRWRASDDNKKREIAQNYLTRIIGDFAPGLQSLEDQKRLVENYNKMAAEVGLPALSVPDPARPESALPKPKKWQEPDKDDAAKKAREKRLSAELSIHRGILSNPRATEAAKLAAQERINEIIEGLGGPENILPEDAPAIAAPPPRQPRATKAAPNPAGDAAALADSIKEIAQQRGANTEKINELQNRLTAQTPAAERAEIMRQLSELRSKNVELSDLEQSLDRKRKAALSKSYEPKFKGRGPAGEPSESAPPPRFKGPKGKKAGSVPPAPVESYELTMPDGRVVKVRKKAGK